MQKIGIRPLVVLVEENPGLRSGTNMVSKVTSVPNGTNISRSDDITDDLMDFA